MNFALFAVAGVLILYLVNKFGSNAPPTQRLVPLWTLTLRSSSKDDGVSNCGRHALIDMALVARVFQNM
jgi:hypothetical protein